MRWQCAWLGCSAEASLGFMQQLADSLQLLNLFTCCSVDDQLQPDFLASLKLRQSTCSCKNVLKADWCTMIDGLGWSCIIF